MWRRKLGLIAIVTLGAACSGDDGLTDEEDFARRVEAHKEATFAVTFPEPRPAPRHQDVVSRWRPREAGLPTGEREGGIAVDRRARV